MSTSPSPTPSSLATIGRTIIIKGDLSGDEDLLIEGQVEGEISLQGHDLTVGPGGKVKADIHGQRIRIEGSVKGNLFGSEEVQIRESGEVQGNITAPRVSLENGSKFKGSIDMEPKRNMAKDGASAGAHGNGAKSDGANRAAGAGNSSSSSSAPGGPGMPPPKAKTHGGSRASTARP